MDETHVNEKTIGSVKAAIDKYGGKFNRVTNTDAEKKTPEVKNSKPHLHIAKKRINQINEDMEMAEKQKTQAELELLKAKKLVKDLNTQIEASKAQMKELDVLKKTNTEGVEYHHYTEVAQVEAVKREISKIRLNMACLSEEKSRAETEAEIAGLKIKSCKESIEQLRAEIEAVNEEEVLVELARIEACKELAEIEVQRKEEFARFSSKIKETRMKIDDMRLEIEEMKDLEEKLAVTNSDVEVLQQLKLIKEMDASVGLGSVAKNSEGFEGAKKELESIQGGATQLMTSMDGVRIELERILEEKDKLKKSEEKYVNTAKNLDSKLMKAKHSLQIAVSSEEKAKLTLSSLQLALEKLGKEKEAAEKERAGMIKEAISTKDNIQKTETETDSTEEKLQDAIQELAEVKSAEAKSLKKLKGVIENAVRSRASEKKPTIRISRFEYDYLTGCAVEAHVMADKKVAAACAWAEALKASEREINMKVAAAERKVEELRLREEQQMIALGKSFEEFKSRNFEENRSIEENAYALTIVPQSMIRKSLGFPTTKHFRRSGSFTMKRRRKVMLKLAKYFVRKRTKDAKKKE